jgi:hypothetical protein
MKGSDYVFFHKKGELILDCFGVDFGDHDAGPGLAGSQGLTEGAAEERAADGFRSSEERVECLLRNVAGVLEAKDNAVARALPLDVFWVTTASAVNFLLVRAANHFAAPVLLTGILGADDGPVLEELGCTTCENAGMEGQVD